MGRLSYFSTSDMELKMKDPKFGDRLGVLLLKKGMTQGELAKKIGCSEATISKYINNINIPQVPILVEMAKALDTTPNYLLGFNEKGR